VLVDVLDELISAAEAREDYGVAIDPESLTVDEATTLELRAAHRGGEGDD